MALRLGLRTLDAAEVLDGLAAGDRVLLTPSVRPGERVRARVVAWDPATRSADGDGADPVQAISGALGR